MFHHSLAFGDRKLSKQEEASRGFVAIQFGLPRPALRNADWVVREVFLAA